MRWFSRKSGIKVFKSFVWISFSLPLNHRSTRISLIPIDLIVSWALLDFMKIYVINLALNSGLSRGGGWITHTYHKVQVTREKIVNISHEITISWFIHDEKLHNYITVFLMEYYLSFRRRSFLNKLSWLSFLTRMVLVDKVKWCNN